MHFKNGSYWYVFRNKWTRLARQLPAALRAYARIIDSGGGLDDLIDRTLEDAARTVRPSTLKQYSAVGHTIKRAFVEFSPDQVRGPHVAQFLDAHHDTPAMANRMRSVLKLAFDKAVLLGQAHANPVTSVPRFKEHKRTRYITDAEYRAIQQEAKPLLAAVMEICLLTGQRIGDVLKMKRTDINDNGIFIEQEKTGQRLVISWSPSLRRAISQARALAGNVRGITLFSNQKGGAASYYTIRDQWAKATATAGVDDVHLHDLRAKAGTDAKAAGQDSKALLGHKSESSHARYLRGLEIPVVEPLRREKS